VVCVRTRAAPQSGPEAYGARVAGRWTRVFAAVAAALAYGAVAARIDPYTSLARLAVAVPVASAVGVAVHDGWHRRGPVRARSLGSEVGRARPADGRAHRPGGLFVWASLFTGLAAWQLVVFTSSPREDNPTFSSLTIEAMAHGPVRAGAWAAWLVLGWYVVRR
jgi:hypothetical protein